MISHTRSTRGPTIGWMMAAVAVSVVLGQLFVCWLNLCGTSQSSLMALAIGLVAGVLLLDWIGQLLPRSSDREEDCPASASPAQSDSRFLMAVGSHRGRAAIRKNLLSVCAALVVVAFCWVLPSLLNATLLAGSETIRISWPLSSLMVMLFPALAVGMVVAATGVFFMQVNPRPLTPWIDSALAGVSGVGLILVFALPAMSSVPLAAASTLAIVTAVVCRMAWGTATAAEPSHASLTVGNEVSEQSSEPLTQQIHTLTFLAAGMLIVAISEFMCRLMPGSLPVMIQTVYFAAIALAIFSRPLTMKLLAAPAMHFFALLTLALLPIMFPLLTDFNLLINTSGLSSLVVLSLRSAQVALCVTAAFIPAICVGTQIQRAISARSAVLSIICGVVLTLGLVSAGVSPVMLLWTAIVVQSLTWLARNVINNRSGTAPRARIATYRRYALPVLSLSCSFLTGFGTADTSRTSSLLFSERTAAAVARGVAQDLILQSHANRLVTTVSSQNGEITVWRRTGNVFEFQRNGMPIGRVSTDTSVSPQPIEDILPAILAMASHAQPSRVLLLGDDTGVSLRTCSHFPVQEIVAVRSDRHLTKLAQQLTWSGHQIPLDQDERIRILHEPAMLAIRRRELSLFDVVIAAGESVTLPSAAHEYTAEFYQAARSRMTAEGVFCQRFRQSHVGPQPLKETMATLMSAFRNVGVIQMKPGEILLLASDADNGLIDPELMVRLQKEHVRREIATAGWDWAQVAILPLLDACDPIGIFSHEALPATNSTGGSGIGMSVPFEAVRPANKQAELHAAFGPHQMQLLAAIPGSEDHHEVKRRLSALAQEMEILAGMPDQPWTYRKSLQMEMKQSPRPPQDLVESGKISKTVHPLDMLRRQYFISLGKALTAASRGELNTELIRRLDTFTDNFEPLITHFAHYEIVRLHELAQHPSPVEEFRHRLHIVFFTTSTDASVRPVISALQQLVEQPALIASEAERYDMLNSLLQKMIERWEARTAWEPRSSLRVQNDVEMSVGVANRAMEQMESTAAAAEVEKIDFYRRRRYVSAALINPLRKYRDQVLAHRMKSEKPPEQNTEDPHDVPLLINSGSGMNTN